MQNIGKNEALLEYYQLLQKGIESFFDQAQIIDRKFNSDGDDSGSIYHFAEIAQIIPEVAKI